jgi:hypothetical protein
MERNWPSVVGLLVAGGYMAFCRNFRAPESAKDLLGAGVSIGAIAVGFLANMKAILFSIDKKRIIQQLKDANCLTNVIDYLYWAIASSSFFSLASAVGLIVDLRGHPKLYPIGVSIWLFSVTTTIASYWRVITIFTRILRSD